MINTHHKIYYLITRKRNKTITIEVVQLAQANTVADKSFYSLQTYLLNAFVCSVQLNSKYRKKEHFQSTGSFSWTTVNSDMVKNLL